MLSNSERVGHRIRAARKAKGMSQAQLAEALHVSERTIGGWEKGDHAPQPQNLVVIYSVLDMEPHQMDMVESWPEDLERFLVRILGPALSRRSRSQRESSYFRIINSELNER